LQQVTGRSFGEKDFRSGLENGILLCELLNAIKPGLVKKINRLPTPIAGLDNIILFLRGCKELGLKESQLFDPGDLQDTSNRVTIKNTDYSRKLKNVLVTIYWLGKAANSCTSYSGSTLNLKEFEGFLAQMRKETEDIESPKRSIRDSGYIDCWDSERSDSLSPPRHGRDDSFDSLDSFGSRSQQTPSPDVVLRGSSDGRGSDSETDLPHRKMPDVKKDDMLARRTSHGEPKSAVPFNQYLPNKSNQTFYVPAPLRKKKAEREEYRKSWSTATSPLGDRPFRFGPRTAVSDDAESMSMFDMRCEEEAVTQPHSKARHEKLQNIHNQLKEDETRWQDDLARWKSRRRSASQDLIKKEAERKKMERLLAGDGMNERRKSIKTYREIVEEKERRERELHEAYKNAKTQEEAESILQQYTERFTISEAVLERLQMPKILERSHSVEPNSPLKDPNPLRYLRQQSLPAPKFTATIEATIVPTTELEPSTSTGCTSPSKSVPKAVPMLTPKPYSQPKNTQEVLKNFKVDGKVSMNGENVNGMEEKDKECTTVIFTPSPTRSLKFDGVARGDRPPVELKKDPPSVELSLQRPATQSVHKEPTVRPTRTNQPYFLCHHSSAAPAPPECPSPDQKQFKSTAACASPVVKRLEFLPSPVTSEETSNKKDVKKAETEKQKEAELPPTQEVIKAKSLEEKGSVVLPFLKKLPETSQVTLHNSGLQADSDTGDKSNLGFPSRKRFNFWAWDPEEERKRQERWQHEQERLLQEKYQKEQCKLKEEWEKAQREVEEEERRYYEEERKIIEDTVVPFIVSSNSAELLSSSSSATEGNKTVNSTDSNSCPGEGKQKEVTKQKKLLWEQDSMSSLKNKESELWQEKRSVNKVLSGYPETGILKGGSEQEHHTPVMERSSPARLNLPLTQDENVSWNQQLLTKRSPQCTEDIRQRPFLGQTVGQQPSSTGEAKRAGYHENFRSGPSSPFSPAALSQSPNRSVSGKKLCSTCGLPLGKGAAMIIETLGLYFHIQCFRCGVCKGQLGDAASGTDVRIRNGLLNCNDCYIRSRS
ncbi:LIMC1 protein, partial [Certhia brachydactyla]|nr:LIMC1 protein [Certhia brachydactyla]